MSLRGRTVAQEALTPQQRAEMGALFRRYFLGSSAEDFERDLSEKDHVVLIESDTGASIRGFTSLRCLDVATHAGVLPVVYSGDTIIEREAWGSSTLPATWLRAVDQLRQQRGTSTLYWLLICSGFRTYRFLPVYWRDFHPRFDRPTPTATRSCVDEIADAVYGDRYDPISGIVRLLRPQVLENGIGSVDPGRRRNPHIAHFLRENPGWSAGDELVCLAEMRPGNQTRLGARIHPLTQLRRTHGALA